MREKLEEQIKNCNLEKKVILTGKLNENEINNEFLKSDIFVLTSKSESFSLVLCEAMNYGIPCVAFDVDVGPREIIQNGKNGFLIEDRNIDLMIKKIDGLLSNNDIRKKMGIDAKKKASQYYPDKILGKWVYILK